MKKHQIALLIGRFQPFHNGHLYLIKKGLQNCKRLVIGIGSANIIDSNNPITSENREKIIKAVLYKEKLTNRVIKIIYLNDYFDDKKWLENVKKQLVLNGIKKIDLIIGNNNWTNGILEEAGYNVMRFPYYRRKLFEGWRIRKLISENKKWQNRVPDYLISNIKNQIPACRQAGQKTQIKNQKYKHVVLGGTFDRLHKGHKALIDKALEVGENITIGLTTEKLQQKKILKEVIETYGIRKKSIKNYLGCGRIIDIIPISDIYGIATTEAKIQAIVVSKETLINGFKINEERIKKGLYELKIIVVDDVLADDGKLISSERIRAGEIDRDGKVYLNYFKKTLVFSESFKEELRKPVGKIYKSVGAIFTMPAGRQESPKKPVMVIAVGDIIVDSLIKKGIEPDVKIIDYRSRRRVIPAEAGIQTGSVPMEMGIRSGMTNNPGTINSQSAKAVKLAINKFLSTKKSQSIVINGEEDLLALPSILFAPLNSLVLYGHWQYGIIAVYITEEIKTKILNLLRKIL